MPALDFIFSTILIVVLIGVGVFASAIAGMYIAWFFGIALVFGWIPILACATDAEWAISFSGNIMEMAAAWCTVAYLCVGGFLGVLWMTVSDRGELPHGLQVLAFLFPHPAEEHVRQAIATGNPVDGPAMARDLDTDAPETSLGKRIWEHNAKQAARDAEAEARLRRAEARMAEATVELERARAHRDDAKGESGSDWRRED